MKIGYFITACNEINELTKLLLLLKTNITDDDVIGIILDEDNYTEDVKTLCETFLLPNNQIRMSYASLNKDFATFFISIKSSPIKTFDTRTPLKLRIFAEK